MQPEGFSLPASVRRLENWIPHRDPAVWVDEVVSVNVSGGLCLVVLKPGANYLDDSGRVRASSWLEWMAQAFAYVKASQVLSGLLPEETQPKRAFLAAIRNFVLHPNASEVELGQEIRIEVTRTHQLGPMAVVEAQAYRSNDPRVILARAQLKLFAE